MNQQANQIGQGLADITAYNPPKSLHRYQEVRVGYLNSILRNSTKGAIAKADYYRAAFFSVVDDSMEPAFSEKGLVLTLWMPPALYDSVMGVVVVATHAEPDKYILGRVVAAVDGSIFLSRDNGVYPLLAIPYAAIAFLCEVRISIPFVKL